MSIIEDILRFNDSKTPEQGGSPEHNPQMLLIGCIDARKDPIADLGIPKGEALILRNIAALIRGNGEDSSAESSALEFAVKAMKVKHIAVMGHTDCGGIHAALQDVELPSVRAHLSILEDLKEKARKQGATLKEQATILEREAVRMSVQNLLTYDYIADAHKRGELQIHGWIINLATGKLEEVCGGRV